ncbi:MAG: DUF333 domain-containing protein [Myxococcales bacterium]|nr:DUF333 domain-containing protein [Myxococcales bacterium]
MNHRHALRFALAAATLVAACGGSTTPPPPPPQGGPGPAGPGGPMPNMANPASKNCVAKGGRLEIRSDAQGNESGVCVFPDGSSCDEWAFMDGKCQPGMRR